MSDLNLRQIQGVVLRMYRMPQVRHFLLKVNSPAAARVLLGRLASGDERDAPQITTAEEWHVAVPGPRDDRNAAPRRKTDYCLNVGITWPGLVALEVTDRLPRFSHGTFNAFVEGAAKRAEALGDRGASGPETWVSGFGTGNDHVMVTLYALNPEAMETYSTSADRAVCRGAGLRAPGTHRRHGHDRDPGWTSRCPSPRCISGTPTASPRRHPFAEDRNAPSPISSRPANRGSSCCWTRPRTISCRVHPTSGETAASACSR